MANIKIHDVVKGDDYYTITFSEGLLAYGIIISLIPDQPMYVEFMEFAKNMEDILVITEDETPEEFNRLYTKYFTHIMEYINSLAS